MPFLYATLSLVSQTMKHFTQELLYLTEDPLLAVLRDENNVVLTFPAGMV